MHLYRLVGLAELRLVADSGFAAFPPRLPTQPIFYPVLDREYAVQIARDWNTRDEASGYVGFVLEFDVADAFVSRYPVRMAGASQHRELWVPAEELADFNAQISGISVIASFVGPSFSGTIDPETNLPRDLSTHPQRFEVWRQDDNGVEALVASGLDQERAQEMAAEMEARGHKQLYWIKASAP